MSKSFVDQGERNVPLLLQLFLSHLLVGGLALGAYHVLTTYRLQGSLLYLVILLCCGIVGLLLTANILYGRYLLGVWLDYLVVGEQISFGDVSRYWPLKPLFTQVQALSERVGQLVRNVNLTDEYREQLLLQASEEAAQEERNRLARELHDSIKQQIFSIGLSAAAAKVHVNKNAGEAQDAIVDIQQSVKEAQVEMQALLQQLRSATLEHTSLREALQTQAHALGYRTGAQVELHMQDLPAPELFPLHMQEALFRIAQEALANIARHARASNVQITLYQEQDAFHLLIKDNGQGFDMQTVQKGMGLVNLQTRATSVHGLVTIQSVVGKGTEVHARLPLLLPSTVKRDQEQIEREVEHTVERATWGLQLNSGMSSVVLCTVILQIALTPVVQGWLSVFIIGFCCCICLYGYIVGAMATARVVLYRGTDHAESLMLRVKENEGRLRTFRAFLYCFFFGYYNWQGANDYLQHWPVLVFGLFLYLGGYFLLRLPYNKARTSYFRSLSSEEFSWELKAYWRTFVSRSRGLVFAVLFVVVFVALRIQSLNVLKQGSGWIWLFLGGAGIILWITFSLMDYWQYRFWNAMLREGGAANG
ncbi:MAG TPA: sensor histidine kinase [Dictyobacter sp.]|nr:sensor histidine kinase [Dictyobacter sp.]